MPIIGDFIRIPSSVSLRTALLFETTVSEILFRLDSFAALDTFILVSPLLYSSSVYLNSSKLSTSSLINFLSIFILDNFFKSF